MKLRTCVIGVGGMGNIHMRQLAGNEHVELTAACDINPDRLEKLDGPPINIDTDAGSRQVDLSGVRRYGDWRELLDAETPDLVAICTPTHLHGEMAIAAMKAGAHVFCEKPIALGGAEARRVANVAAERERKLLIGHVLRFYPEYVAIKRLIDEGTYGPVRSAVFRRLGGLPGWGGESWFHEADKAGGALMDLHIHDVDTIQWYFGRPSAVRARGVTHPTAGVTHVLGHFAYDGDAMIVAEAAWLDGKHPFFMTLTVEFAEATVAFDGRLSPTLNVYHAKGDEVLHPDLPDERAYAGETAYLVDCIRNDQPVSRVTPADAASAVEIAEAEERSIESGEVAAL